MATPSQALAHVVVMPSGRKIKMLTDQVDTGFAKFQLLDASDNVLAEDQISKALSSEFMHKLEAVIINSSITN